MGLLRITLWVLDGDTWCGKQVLVGRLIVDLMTSEVSDLSWLGSYLAWAVLDHCERNRGMMLVQITGRSMHHLGARLQSQQSSGMDGISLIRKTSLVPIKYPALIGVLLIYWLKTLRGRDWYAGASWCFVLSLYGVCGYSPVALDDAGWLVQGARHSAGWFPCDFSCYIAMKCVRFLFPVLPMSLELLSLLLLLLLLLFLSPRLVLVVASNHH